MHTLSTWQYHYASLSIFFSLHASIPPSSKEILSACSALAFVSVQDLIRRGTQSLVNHQCLSCHFNHTTQTFVQRLHFCLHHCKLFLLIFQSVLPVCCWKELLKEADQYWEAKNKPKIVRRSRKRCRWKKKYTRGKKNMRVSTQPLRNIVTTCSHIYTCLPFVSHVVLVVKWAAWDVQSWQ